jgi:hypothetical protein
VPNIPEESTVLPLLTTKPLEVKKSLENDNTSPILFWEVSKVRDIGGYPPGLKGNFQY